MFVEEEHLENLLVDGCTLSLFVLEISRVESDYHKKQNTYTYKGMRSLCKCNVVNRPPLTKARQVIFQLKICWKMTPPIVENWRTRWKVTPKGVNFQQEQVGGQLSTLKSDSLYNDLF